MVKRTEHMVRGRWAIRDGKLVQLSTSSSPTSHIPKVHEIKTDSMPGTWHPANGQWYDSKSAFRRVTKAYGLREIGDQAKAPEAKPIDTRELDRTRKQAIAETMEQLGYRGR